MRKNASRLSLFVFLLAQVSSLCWYLYKPVSHIWFETAHELKHACFGQHKKLKALTINRNELQKLSVEDDEIVIAGMRYDIERSVISGNKIILFLECDFEETQSDIQNARLSKQINKNAGPAAESNSNNRNVFFVFYFSKENITDNFMFPASKKKFGNNIDTNYDDYFSQYINPPPEYL